MNRHEELSDRSAPYADFGHGSLFEAAPGARGFPGTAESPTKFHFMPVEICMEDGGLHAYFNRRQASPSTAASGLKKTSGSGQGPSWRDHGRDLGVRCGVPTDARWAGVPVVRAVMGFFGVLKHLELPNDCVQDRYTTSRPIAILQYCSPHRLHGVFLCAVLQTQIDRWAPTSASSL